MKINDIFGTVKKRLSFHIRDISFVSPKYRPMCAAGFAEDNRDITDERGKEYAKYIKTHAAKLVDTALEHPSLFYLMIREKLIPAKDLETFTNAVQASGNTEYISAMLEYGNSSVLKKNKAKVAQKKEKRDECVTNFIFNSQNIGEIKGKKIAISGKLKTFKSRDVFRECIEAAGAIYTEQLENGVNYFITNTKNTEKDKAAAKKFWIQRITEDEFNELIGRKL